MSHAGRKVVLTLTRRANGQRWLHATATRRAVTSLHMPAMSPTMTEGGIASWKKKEGDSFSAGEVLLEIETDKATIDVEAQDDGVVGKILAPDGAKGVKVGTPIALLAEEGDDISNLEAPQPEASSSSSSSASASSTSPPPQPQQTQSSPPPPLPTPSTSSTHANGHGQGHPTHSRPLFPSVLRILTEHGISETSAIEGTGVRGMLTKGDVLAYLGKASGPLGTFQDALEKDKLEREKERSQKGGSGAGLPAKEKKLEPLDGSSLRKAIVTSMLNASLKARNPPAPKTSADFDSVIADYLPNTPKPASASASSPTLTSIPPPTTLKSSPNFLEGLF